MKLLGGILGLLSNLGLFGIVVLLLAVNKFSAELPNYKQLEDYHPPLVTRVLAGDGRLLAEYAIEKRVFVPISAIPSRVKRAFLSAEDKTFYTHPGIDFPGIAAAMLTNVKNYGSDRRPIGASTITQQVAKNFFFSGEATRSLRAQGQGADPRLPHRAGLLQGPHPRALPQRDLSRVGGLWRRRGGAQLLRQVARRADDRRGRLSRRPAEGAQQLSPHAASRGGEGAARLGDRPHAGGRLHHRERGRPALAEPLLPRKRGTTEAVSADYFAEEVRRELGERYGEGARGLYEGGLSVRTTLDPKLQEIADRVLRAGLVAYDRATAGADRSPRSIRRPDWQKRLAMVPAPEWLYEWHLAMVLEAGAKDATIGFADGSEGTIPLAELRWARHAREGKVVGASIAKAVRRAEGRRGRHRRQGREERGRQGLPGRYLCAAPDARGQRRASSRWTRTPAACWR